MPKKWNNIAAVHPKPDKEVMFMDDDGNMYKGTTRQAPCLTLFGVRFVDNEGNRHLHVHRWRYLMEK